MSALPSSASLPGPAPGRPRAGSAPPWAALGLGAAALLGALFLPLLRQGLPVLPPCAFKHWTGLACPTCGLTRWAQALARGDWASAFHWHPLACLLLLLAPLVALWDLRRAWLRLPYPELPGARAARWTAGLIFLGAWLLQTLRGI